MYDYVITGGRVVNADGSAMADVGISGEKIAAIGPAGTLVGSAAEVVDASGCMVVPGGIDPHTHYAMLFGPLECEGPEYAFAAAIGGTTTVVDFVFHELPNSVHQDVQEKRDRFDGNIAVDYGLHVIMTKDFGHESIDELGDVIRNGIPTIKTMMTYEYLSNDGQRFGVMQELAKHGGMAVVHAEDDALANWLTQEYIRQGKVHGAYISETRGPIVEEAAVRRAIFLAEKTGVPLYVLHMGAGSAVNALAEAAGRGRPVYGETLSVYMGFTQKDLWDDSVVVGANGKSYIGRGLLAMNYPVPKFEEDRREIFAALSDGRLATIGTDHSSTSVEQRFDRMGTTLDTFVQAGQSAAELRVPLAYHQGVVGGHFSENRWVELVSSNPAKLMGLWPRKGAVREGFDADVVIFDPNKKWTVDFRELHGTCDYNIWDGWELEGKVRDTFLRGKKIVENGDFVGSKSGGKFVPRTLLPEFTRSNPDLGQLRRAVS